MNVIHPSAVIGKGARLGDGNQIGPGCVIDSGSALGSRNTLWMNVYVGPGTTIGDENQIHMGAVIGHVPQDLSFSGAASSTAVGHRNVFREYVTVHRGAAPDSSTVIGDDNFFMANAHVAHNCRVGHRAIFANAATLAGHCVVEDQALLSGLVVVHQFVRIGRLAMVSGLSAVNKDVPPYLLCGGRPAVIQGVNVVGLRRAGLSPAARADIKHAYKLLYREGLGVANATARIARECQSAEAKELAAFVASSQRGISAGLASSAPQEDDEAASSGESLLPRKPH